MIDVSRKSSTLRTARASARVSVKLETNRAIQEGRVPKGDPLIVARVAAIQSAKNTQLIIPYCHPVPLDFVGVEFSLGDNYIDVRTEVKAVWKTGVEMEAMTAASTAALTLYDMLKMIDNDLVIEEVRLESKTGGKSDSKEAFATSLRAAVLVLSDSVAAGVKRDTAGEAIAKFLQEKGLTLQIKEVVPDDEYLIAERLIHYADELEVDLILTTGGTGLGPRDVTPEATGRIIERAIPGLAEALRNFGSARTPHASLTRALAGQRGKTIIVNLPGSERGAIESLDAIMPALLHACVIILGGEHAEATNRVVNSSPQ